MRFVRRSAASVVRISVALTCAAVLVAQLAALDGVRAMLGGGPVLSRAGLFAVLGFAQTLLYAVLVVDLVGSPRGPSIDAPRPPEPLVVDSDPDPRQQRWRARLWLIGWLAALMGLRACLGQLPGFAPPLLP